MNFTVLKLGMKLQLLKSLSHRSPEFEMHHEFHIKSHNKHALNAFGFNS